MSVLKSLDISSTSTISFEDAVVLGLKKTSKTVHHICSAQILNQSIKIEDEQIKEYIVEMKVQFVVND